MNSGIKGLDILWNILQENIRESRKSYDQRSKKKDKKLKVTIKVVNNGDCKYPDTKIYIGENLKEKM